MTAYRPMDLSAYSDAQPVNPVHLLFIHHSCGGQLMAALGEDKGESCIYVSHPNGGGLRGILEDSNYVVHEASYGSVVGDKTDVCHWNAKFRDHMDRILITRHQDETFADGTENQVVVFKSCFPNNWIVSDGVAPGDPDDCERTYANMQAAYRALLPLFVRQPETLFVAMTAPPLAEPGSMKNRIKNAVKKVIGREETTDRVGRRALAFNAWLSNVETGWLSGYDLNNVVVFDLYRILTDDGASAWSAYPSGGGNDSHPASKGNTLAAERFMTFVNQTLQRHGVPGGA